MSTADTPSPTAVAKAIQIVESAEVCDMCEQPYPCTVHSNIGGSAMYGTRLSPDILRDTIALALDAHAQETRERIAQLEAEKARAWEGLANIYEFITDRQCPVNVALGMATSAVQQLYTERDALRTQLATKEQETREACAKIADADAVELEEHSRRVRQDDWDFAARRVRRLARAIRASGTGEG